MTGKAMGGWEFFLYKKYPLNFYFSTIIIKVK